MLQTSSVQKKHVLPEVLILNIWNILCVSKRSLSFIKMLLNVIKATCEQSSASSLAGKELHYCLLHVYSFSVSTSQGTSPYSCSKHQFGTTQQNILAIPILQEFSGFWLLHLEM